MNEYLFWFFFRRGIFQVFLPIALGLMTYFDFFTQKSNDPDKMFYHYIYFYTSLILFIYAILGYIIRYIFDMTSSNVIFIKDLDETSSLLNKKNIIININEIFDLKYSKNIFLKFISNICWLLGINSPVFISYKILEKINPSYFISLNETLHNLYNYEKEFITYDSIEYEISKLKDFLFKN